MFDANNLNNWQIYYLIKNSRASAAVIPKKFFTKEFYEFLTYRNKDKLVYITDNMLKHFFNKCGNKLIVSDESERFKIEKLIKKRLGIRMAEIINDLTPDIVVSLLSRSGKPIKCVARKKQTKEMVQKALKKSIYFMYHCNLDYVTQEQFNKFIKLIPKNNIYYKWFYYWFTNFELINEDNIVDIYLSIYPKIVHSMLKRMPRDQFFSEKIFKEMMRFFPNVVLNRNDETKISRDQMFTILKGLDCTSHEDYQQWLKVYTKNGYKMDHDFFTKCMILIPVPTAKILSTFILKHTTKPDFYFNLGWKSSIIRFGNRYKNKDVPSTSSSEPINYLTTIPSECIKPEWGLDCVTVNKYVLIYEFPYILLTEKLFDKVIEATNTFLDVREIKLMIQKLPFISHTLLAYAEENKAFPQQYYQLSNILDGKEHFLSNRELFEMKLKKYKVAEYFEQLEKRELKRNVRT